MGLESDRTRQAVITFACVLLAPLGCGNTSEPFPLAKGSTASVSSSLTALQNAFPSANLYTVGERVSRLYGATLAKAATPAASAESFRRQFTAAFGLGEGDLVGQELNNGEAVTTASPQGLGLMYDPKTEAPKFFLYRYGQTAAGLPVYRASLLVLVRNGGDNAAVWAASSVRSLGTFAAPTLATAPTPDADKTLKSIRPSKDGLGNTVPAPARLVSMSDPKLIVFGGEDGQEISPVLAIQYDAEVAEPEGKWRVVANAANGDIIRVENLISYYQTYPISGSVTGLVTQGAKAMECANTVSMPWAYPRITIISDHLLYGQADGTFSDQMSPATEDMISLMEGVYFAVATESAPADEIYKRGVTSPGPVSFVHNANSGPANITAQSNAMVQATQVRDFVLRYVHDYPTISNERRLRIIANRNSGLCPGNAWFDHSANTLNFCAGDTTYTNTSFGDMNHHEYAHHVVQCGGSGQGEYGEGVGDTIAMLMSGDPGFGYGLTLNNCSTPVRTAINDCEYSETGTLCGGPLLSGLVWDIRTALAASYPSTYQDIISQLFVSSIPLHLDDRIDASLAVDLLMIDDDDGDPANGTPHYDFICNAFAARDMHCPLRVPLSTLPDTDMAFSGPVGGPFTPSSVSWVMKNVGQAPFSYSIAPMALPNWASASPASGQLAVGDEQTVTVTFNQTYGATMAPGRYKIPWKFENVTNAQGNILRTTFLEVGTPRTAYVENFENGLGGFVLSGATNLWHLTTQCAAGFRWHSPPTSLYFGQDSNCTYNTSAIASGTATSPAFTISDTAAAYLVFRYYLGTEKTTNYDKATAAVSVNNGPWTVVASNYREGVALQDGSLQNGSRRWATAEVDLAPLLQGLTSPSVQVRFAFDTVDDYRNQYTGFLVDDISVMMFTGNCTSDAQCNDGQYCNGVERCIGTTCTPGAPVDCADSVACTLDSCNETTDSCDHMPLQFKCDDGNACNGAEVCDAVLGCRAGTAPNCDDGNECTTDSCDASLGCVHTNRTGSCTSDGNVCTDDVCSNGECTHANNTAPCADDGDACTTDVCGGGICTHPSSGTCLQPFLEMGGQVAMEAENFDKNTGRASHTWDVVSNGSASGGKVMQTNPNNGTSINSGYVSGSPQLDYKVKFATTGTFYVWVRGYGPGTADRTCHAGIDGTGPNSADRMGTFGSSLGWSRSTLDSTPATISITSAGVHTVSIWMRDDGFIMDKIFLTTNSTYTPSGAGPGESPRGGCSSNSDCNDGNPCTQDVCSASVCQHNAMPAGTSCTDDGDSCTNDVCSGTTCTHPSNGRCGGGPCAGFCATPTLFNGGNYQSGNLTISARCYQTTGTINSGNCGNFSSSRSLYVNGSKMACNGAPWSSLPAKVNNGYCIYTNGGDWDWAYFTTW